MNESSTGTPAEAPIAPPLPEVEVRASETESAKERALRRARYWSRLLLGLFLIVTAANLVWSIPGLRPGGGEHSLFGDEFGVQTLLAGAAAALALLYVGMRDKMRAKEVSLLAWSAVRDRLSHMRGHEYFFDRLSIECQKANRDGYPFAVVVLRLNSPAGIFPDLGRVHRALALLEPLSSEYDWLAAIGANELAMLSPGTSAKDAPAFASRMQRLVTGAIADQEQIAVSAGWAVYSENGLSHPAELLARARQIASVR